jgi:lysophospholipase L1-like esterase
MRRREFLANAGLTLGTASAGIWGPIARAVAAPAIDKSVSPVGVRTNVGQGWSDPALRWMVTRLAHVMPSAASDIQLVYANLTRSREEYEAAGPNPIAISAAIEFPEGSFHPAVFGSRSEMSVAGGETVISDLVRISIPAQAVYYTRTTVRAEAAPYLWPYTRVSSPHCGDWVNTGAEPSQISTDPPARRDRQSKAFGPLNILGKTEGRHVSVAVLGDSVVAGEPGPGDRLGGRGFLERALGANVAWCNLAENGDNLAAFLKSHETRLSILRQNFTHVICALGIGDIRGGNEAAIRARYLQLWQLLSDLGVKVLQTTITTHTSSSDAWTTTEGQTIVNPNFLPGGIYNRINDWIRSKPSPLAGYFDPSAVLETEPDSGIWIAPNNAPVTNDGPHLNGLGAEIGARSVDLTKLTL